MSKLRYLLILDFEATCCNDRSIPADEIEIIEFPTLLYGVEEAVLVETLPGSQPCPATFHEYVRPVLHPKLTRFCTELTGIEQSTVDKSDTFPTVWRRHLGWSKELGVFENPDSYAYLTCGDWDMKTALPKELRRLNTMAPEICTLERVVNIKKAFKSHHNIPGSKGYGMGTARFSFFLFGVTNFIAIRRTDAELPETSSRGKAPFRHR